jgi:hypothetical protein
MPLHLHGWFPRQQRQKGPPKLRDTQVTLTWNASLPMRIPPSAWPTVRARDLSNNGFAAKSRNDDWLEQP